jgi:hypothetical protein
MNYMWHINISYQNGHKIIINKIYVHHKPHPKFDDINIDVMSHATMVIHN